MTPTSGTSTSLRCRFGRHRMTTVPREIVERAKAKGLSPAFWYVGRTVDPWCQRCGKGGS